MENCRSVGSAVVVLFDASLQQVASGFSTFRQERMFFRLRVSEEDVVVVDMSEEDIARACALRGLGLQAGLTQADLQMLVPVRVYRRQKFDWPNNVPYFAFRYVFLAVLKPAKTLPESVRWQGLIQRQFHSVVNSLTSWNLLRGDLRRISPSDAIALFYCIQYIHELVQNDQRFESFTKVYEDLPKRYGVDPQSFVSEVVKYMKTSHV